jgi:hypothetical protein
MSVNPTSLDQAEQVLDLIQVSEARHLADQREIDRLKGELQKAAALQAQYEKAKTLIPETVEAMVQFQRIHPEAREKMAALLADPEQMMKLLKRAADADDNIRTRPMGQPEPQPAPSGGGHTNGHVKRASDQRFTGTSLGQSAREREAAAVADYRRALTGGGLS